MPCPLVEKGVEIATRAQEQGCINDGALDETCTRLHCGDETDAYLGCIHVCDEFAACYPEGTTF